MRPSLTLSAQLVLVLLLLAPPAFADTFPKNFPTRFTTIAYREDPEIDLFIWRISGSKMPVSQNPEWARGKVDGIVEKVEAVLDLYPEKLHVDIYLKTFAEAGRTAFYSHEDRRITVAMDRVTDGVLAHEMAHAVVCAYYPVALPDKVQEILAQYVDENLWSDGI